jgi:hypothetical protein
MLTQAVCDWQSASMQLIPCGLVAIWGGALGDRVLPAAFRFWACTCVLSHALGTWWWQNEPCSVGET